MDHCTPTMLCVDQFFYNKTGKYKMYFPTTCVRFINKASKDKL